MPESLFNKAAGLKPATSFKKEALAQVFSCAFYEISINTFFTEHLSTTASVLYKAQQWNDVFIGESSILKNVKKRKENKKTL